jgi:hypothetical protein
VLKKIVLYSGFVILFLWWIYRKMYHPDETGIYKVKTEEIISYDTIVGPAEGTALPAESFTTWKKFAKGGTSSIAILVTDTNSSWLASGPRIKIHRSSLFNYSKLQSGSQAPDCNGLSGTFRKIPETGCVKAYSTAPA